jgi:antitoxin (DNA-binding transcriptional repressor) of toxin-antitoxin stability system
MKNVTASAARETLFQLLDQVVRGEKIVIEHRGRRIVMLSEDLEEAASSKGTPDYSTLLQVPDADEADQWSWNWSVEGFEPHA